MSGRAGNRPRKKSSPDTRWLNDDEQAAWRAIATVLARLPWVLECQLQRDDDLSFIEYHALARLSENDNHTVRMSELAAVTNASLSRLSHLVKRLETRGLVRREPDPTDGRFTNASLTDRSYAKLVASAPARRHGSLARHRSIQRRGTTTAPRVLRTPDRPRQQPLAAAESAFVCAAR